MAVTDEVMSKYLEPPVETIDEDATTIFFDTIALQQENYPGHFFVRSPPLWMFVRPHFTEFSSLNRQIFLGVYAPASSGYNRDGESLTAEVMIKLHPFRGGLPALVEYVHVHFDAFQNFHEIAEFANWDHVMDPQLGYSNNGKILLECTVRTDCPPEPVFCEKKDKNVFVGLRNQGATCYMNSILQTLFFLNKLRKATYQISTKGGDRTDKIILALQEIFYNLQFNEAAVETNRLTKSFGWTSTDILVQHDAQELCRLLLAEMETKMKPCKTIQALFEGRTVSYVKCKNVDYESKREEPFQDIQLNVKKNIMESFRDYCAKELLDGNNKYDAGDHGLQEAEKGVIFKSLPPVLYLHLMRFRYDPATDSNVKVNDRCEFSKHLDLEEFLEDKEDTPAHYTLYAVLVHSQFTTNSGHYTVYLNPECRGKWYMFNDESVVEVTEEQVIEANFGGDPANLNTNAYVLVYIRASAIADVFQEVRILPLTRDVHGMLSNLEVEFSS